MVRVMNFLGLLPLLWDLYLRPMIDSCLLNLFIGREIALFKLRDMGFVWDGMVTDFSGVICIRLPFFR